MKRIFALLATSAIGLAGCNSSNSAKPTSASGPDAKNASFKVALITPGDVNDQGWNQLAYEGLEQLKAKGYTTSNQVIKVASDRQPALRDLAGPGVGANLVLLHGGEMGDDAKTVAPQFVHTDFVVVAGNVAQQPNVASMVPKFEEATYLLGMAAGGMTKSNKIGLIGGARQDVIDSTFDAFERGVKATNPRAVVTIKYVGNYEDQNMGKELARSLIADGADVLFHNADQAGKGMFVAAQESLKAGHPVYVFGSNRNQNDVAPDVTVASAVIRLIPAFQDVVTSVQNHTFKAAPILLNLKNNEIAVEWNPKLKSLVPAKTQAAMDVAAKNIIAGKLTITRMVN